MGRKSHNKKYRNKPQPSAAKASAPASAVKAVMPASLQAGAQPVMLTPSQPLRPINKNASPLDIQADFVRQDIVRILTLLIIVAVVLIGFLVINQRGTALHRAGQSLTRFLQLQ